MRAYGSLPKLISLTVSTITVLIKVSDAGISFSHYQSAQVWCYRKLCSFVSPGFNFVLHVLSIFFFFLGAAGNSANKLLLLVCHRLSAAMLILLFAVNLLMLIYSLMFVPFWKNMKCKCPCFHSIFFVGF